jgi:hypothetical protein
MGNLLILQYPESAEEGFPKEGEYCECSFFDQSYDRYYNAYAGSLRTVR